jgi:hypothetical protein
MPCGTNDKLPLLRFVKQIIAAILLILQDLLAACHDRRLETISVLPPGW